MNLKLLRLTEEYRPQLEDMMTEWTASGEHILPAAIRRHDFRDFEGYINELELTEERDGLFPRQRCSVSTRNGISSSERSIYGII